MRTCSVDECNEKCIARNYCTKHYQRWKKYGDPLATKTAPNDEPADERLKRHGWTITESGCWEWNGNTSDRRGYGSLRFHGRTVKAHRLAYSTWVGEIPEGMVVMHLCDNPPCINPDHLKVGTNDENMQDMLTKNRQASGNRHWNYKHGNRVGVHVESRQKKVAA